MSSVTLRIPMIAAVGPLALQQISRDFQGVMPEIEPVAFVARIIREGLEAAHFPEYRRLIELSDDYLVEQVVLVKAVPNDVWIRNGLVPLSGWTPAR